MSQSCDVFAGVVFGPVLTSRTSIEAADTATAKAAMIRVNGEK